jgi:hypothetical protein
MKEQIAERFEMLVREGQQLVRRLPRARGGNYDFYVEPQTQNEYQAWLSSTGHLIKMVSPPNSHYPEEFSDLVGGDQMKHSVVPNVVERVYGLLTAAQRDWSDGLLRQIEYMVAAATFDEFLDHAAEYHKGGKKVEAAVLASAVLEDTVKKIAAKNDIAFNGLALEQLVDELTRSQVFTLVKAKRVKAAAGVRNHALHAEWDQFDIKDAGTLIGTIRELLENYL